jgi:uncharacterized HAD superfamily protein
MRIGLDIDGVILDFERVMRTYAEFYDLITLNKKGVINCEEFSYLKRYDWNKEEKDDFINKYLIYGTSKTPLLPGVIEGIQYLNEQGHQLIPITARGTIKKETMDAVKERFKEENLNFNKIYWQTEDKVRICKEEKIDIMIDDNPNICEELAQNNILCFYFRDKDNKKLIENAYLKEVKNWGEICRYITNISSQDNKDTNQ